MPVSCAAALVQLLKHIFCLGLAQKAARVQGECSATWTDREQDESPQECSLTWSELKGSQKSTRVCVPVIAGMDWGIAENVIEAIKQTAESCMCGIN